MKKIILGIALALFAVIGFSSCGTSATQTSDSVSDSVEQVAEDSAVDSAADADTTLQQVQ